MKEQKIVITTDGKIILARLYEDNEVVKRAEAKCCPSDTFDFKTDAELALSRVFEQEKEDIFPLADIKPGYLLACEVEDTGEKFNMTVTMGKVKRLIFTKATEELVCFSAELERPKHFWPLSNWGEGLQYTSTGGRTYKVLAVYGYTYPAQANRGTIKDRELLWERKVAPKVAPKTEITIEVGDKVRVIGNSGPFHYLKIGGEAEVRQVRDKFITVTGEDCSTGYPLPQTVSINDVEKI